MKTARCKRYNWARIALICITLFVGIGAVGGSIMMFADPAGTSTGMAGMLPAFQVLPFADVLFQDLIFSGIMLLIVNGITNLVAAALMFAKKPIGVTLGKIFGITLMMWIVIQFVIFPLNFMSMSFFVIGAIQFVVGLFGVVGYQQSLYHFDATGYSNIGTKPNNLVVFFSRTGYTKKLAYELANNSGAEILEVVTTEKIAGDLGFWWCGRFGMHRWGMTLKAMDIDWAKYDNVTICSPVWVFGVSAPIRQFLTDNAGKINNVSYVLTHYMNAKFANLADQMDKILGTKHISLTSYRCRYGKLKKLK